jgi:Aminoglycoside-2''-adenylyltransferase
VSSATAAFDPLVYPWDAWRPEEVARRLRGVDLPWYVAAGWSIDLFLGGERREHEDLEIAAPAARFAELAAALPGLEFFAINDRLAYSIEHEPEALEGSHQTWGLDRSAGVWRIDVFREPADGETWIWRRDESIRLTGGEHIERTTEGLPYARPELTLLFKAKHARPKDDDDLSAVLDVLEPARRKYLAHLLAIAHPGHRWLELIDSFG